MSTAVIKDEFEQDIINRYKHYRKITEEELNKIIDNFEFVSPNQKKLFWLVTREIAETNIFLLEE